MKNVKSKYTLGNLLFFTDDNYAIKNGIFSNCPILAANADPFFCHDIKEDFAYHTGYQSSTALGGWTYSQSSSGAMGIQDLAGGVLAIDSGGVTAGHGSQLQKIGENTQIASDKDLWFEARFKITGVSNVQLFIGLAETQTDLLVAGDLNASKHLLGFGIEADAGATLSLYESEATAELSDEIGTVVSDTYIKVGFRIDESLNIKAFVDDAEVTLSNVVTAGLPTALMTPTLICQTNGNATQPILYVDYFRMVQRR